MEVQMVELIYASIKKVIQIWIYTMGNEFDRFFQKWSVWKV
jgi:hypothetical protein